MRAERFKVISVLDDAWDLNMQDRLDYAGTRDYEAYKHRLLPGAKPVIFHVREVPHVLWEDYVDAPDNFAEKYKRAFICGIEKVENLLMTDGVSLGTWTPNTKNIRSGAVILSDDDLSLFAPAERAEIGSVIYTHSFLSRRMQATYLLPRSLQDPLVSQAARHAQLSQRAAEAKNKNAHSDLSSLIPTGTDKTHASADAG